MKRLARLFATAAALTVSSSALACGLSRPFLREAPPDNARADEIVAEVEVDISTPISINDRGTRLRVRRMIQGEPATFLIVLPSPCSVATTSGLSGFLVATRVGSHDNIPVVEPVFPAIGRLFDPPGPAQAVGHGRR